MNRTTLATVVAAAWAGIAGAATNYVWRDNPVPQAPYDDWTNAATAIQDAVDAAADGDIILVTNGVYDNGVGVFNYFGSLQTNRVFINKSIALVGVTGPDNVVIDGGGDWCAVRIEYLGGGTRIEGFTMTNGFSTSASAGGIACNACVTVLNCRVVGNRTPSASGGVQLNQGGLVSNCHIARNTTDGVGGGIRCDEGTIVRCIVADNTASNSGGGVALFSMLSYRTSVVEQCEIVRNGAPRGGGVYASVSAPCGGIFMRNCLVAFNAALEGAGQGAGIMCNGGTFQNCTIASNIAAHSPGGIAWGGAVSARATNLNVIVYHNEPDNMDTASSYIVCRYCCALPLPPGAGNVSNDPRFVSVVGGDVRLDALSPCVNTGSNLDWMADATDLAGTNRILFSVVDMGAFECTVPEPAAVAAAAIASWLFIVRRRVRRGIR